MTEPLKTTLCYLECRGCWLMLLRNKKPHDVNAGKWLGVGGKFLPGESPEECLVREVREETGFSLAAWEARGVVHFISDRFPAEDMFLFTASVEGACDGALPPVPECDEGTFAWVPCEEVAALSLWEGDRIFLERLLRGECGIDLTLEYEGDALVRASALQ